MLCIFDAGNMKTILAFCAFFCFPLLGESLKSPWIDLSYPYNNETIGWPTATDFKHIKVFENITAAGFYLAMYDISVSEHGGTHLDAPSHFAKGKWTLDQIPLDRLIGPAIKIDISSKAAKVRYFFLKIQPNQTKTKTKK